MKVFIEIGKRLQEFLLFALLLIGIIFVGPGDKPDPFSQVRLQWFAGVVVVDKYVDPSASGDNDGSSWANAWTTINSLEGAAKDLQTADEQWDIHCKNGPDALADDYLNLATTWNVDATRFVRIVADVGDRHDGTAHSGYYITYTGSYGIINRNAYARFEFIEIEGDGSGDCIKPVYGLSGPATADIRIDGCLLHNAEEVITVDGAADNLYIYNTIIYDGGGYGIMIEADSTVKIYSTSVIDCDRCIRLNAANSVADMKNVLMRHDGVQCLLESAGAFTLDYCASSDGTADDFLGANNQVDQTYTFTDNAGNNFHLASDDVGAIDLGIDTSGEGAPLNFSTDMDGEERTGDWDIGADQYVAAGGGRTTKNTRAFPLGEAVGMGFRF